MRVAKAFQLQQWHILTLMYVGLVLLHIWWGLDMVNPIIYNDEAGYFGSARQMASGYGLPPMGVEYYPGYSIFLVPIFKLIDAPLLAYRGALIVNAFLLSTISITTYLLAKRFCPDARPSLWLIAALLVSCYPSFLAYSNLVMSENAYIPIFIVLCLTGMQAFKKYSWRAWFLWGSLSGFLFTIHPKALPVLAAAIAISFKILLINPCKSSDFYKRLYSFAGVLTGILTVTVLGTVLRKYLSVRLDNINQLSGYDLSTSKTLLQFSELSSLLKLIYEIAGQVFYLGTATYGLFIVGVGVSFILLKKFLLDREKDSSIAVGAFISLSMMGTLMLSSAFMNANAARADHLIYGRYNEGVLAPVLMLGVVGLLHPFWTSRITWHRWLLYIVVTLIASGSLLYLGRMSEPAFKGSFVFINVLGIYPFLAGHQGLSLTIILTLLGVTVAVSSLFFFLLQRFKKNAFLILMTLFLLTGYSATSFLVLASKGYQEVRVVPDTINSILGKINARNGNQELSCIASQKALLSNSYGFYATVRFLAPQAFFEAFNPSEEPCSDLVLSNRLELDQDYPGARLVTLENHHMITLWSLPGSLQQQLDASGSLLPLNFPSALPDTAFKSEISLEEVQEPIELDDSLALSLFVRHAGQGSPWPNLLGLKQPDYSVRLGLLWFNKADLTASEALSNSSNLPEKLNELRIELPKTLLPGETAKLTVNLEPVDADGFELPSGDYEVWIGLVQEGVAWFYQKGDDFLKLDVRVKGN
jgi:hypothetical protein